jgi:hypothetical protein
MLYYYSIINTAANLPSGPTWPKMLLLTEADPGFQVRGGAQR